MIVGAAYGPVSDIEILWTLLAVVGVVAASFGLRDAVRDRRWLHDQDPPANGLRETMALQRIRDEAGRVFVHGVFGTIGVLAMTIPEAPNQLDLPWNVTLATALVRWGLIACALVLTTQSLLNRRDRIVLRGIAAARERRGRGPRDERRPGDPADRPGPV
jgi:hypothetical protein